jgi:superfamily I DNA/RNA helicase
MRVRFDVPELTGAQREVVDCDGDFLLLACPGSGKTRAAAARVERLSTTRRLAVCSYTNVGADRIATVLRDDFEAVLGPEHFIGTLHRFLLRYVLYPFAGLVGVTAGPWVRERNWPDVSVGGNNRKRIGIDRFRCDPAGNLVVKSRPRTIHESDDELIALVGSAVRDEKRKLAASGFVSFDDAIWLSLKILDRHPEIARAVAGRFEELLLDEAQDTSELQLAALGKLRETASLRSLVLVGDVEQSIFSFQGASAEGCLRLAREAELKTLTLRQNHRCSQRICDVAAHFCDRAEPDEAVGIHAGSPIEPEVIHYPAAEPAIAVALYRERLDEHVIDVGEAAILARGTKLVDELNGKRPSIGKSARLISLGLACATLRNATLSSEQVRGTEAIVAYCAWKAESLEELDEERREALRASTFRLLQDLPALDMDLPSWNAGAAAVLNAAAKALTPKPLRSGAQALPSYAEHTGHRASDVFARPPQELVAQTVHDIKGEDREAVMIVIDRPRSKKHGPQTELWSTALSGGEIDSRQVEEKRIAFVALTRARRYCVVALPDDPHGLAAASLFAEQGFKQVG